jgi:hypothetical protein
MQFTFLACLTFFALFVCNGCDQNSPRSPGSERPSHLWMPREVIALSTSPREWANATFAEAGDGPWLHVIDFCNYANLRDRDRDFLSLTDPERERLALTVASINSSSPKGTDFKTVFQANGQLVGVPAMGSLSIMIQDEAKRLRRDGDSTRADMYANALFVIGWSILLTPATDEMEAMVFYHLANRYFSRAIESLSEERKQQLQSIYDQLRAAATTRPKLN